MMRFLRRVLFDLKRRVNRKFKVLDALQQQSNLPFEVIVSKVEAIILAKIGVVDLTTHYKMLGGSNNLGFLSHEWPSQALLQTLPQTKCCWITKFALNEMLKRESFFLQWHQINVATKKQFAPEWLTAGKLGESNVSFIVTERLTPIKSPSFKQVAELYRACKAGGGIFQTTKTLPLLESGSRIRDVLLHLVSQFDSPEAKVFLGQYFGERKGLLLAYQTEIEQIQKTLDKAFLVIGTIKQESLGFVHGDFKASNMMLCNEKRLKLIDFQYWCYGVRVWDIAFFLSKQKMSFDQTVPVFMHFLTLSEQEKKLLVFFYTMAVLLHPKPKQFKWQFKNQLLPALTVLNNEESLHE